MKKLRKHQRHSSAFSPQEFEKSAVTVSIFSIAINAGLFVFKLFAGIFAGSGAMISDAVHSASDMFSSIIVMVGIKLAAKKSDKCHPYGHERLECVAAIILAVVLLVCGLFIGHTAIEKIGFRASLVSAVPGKLALVAAIVSVIVKEAMYWHTRFYARRFDSGALMADAWHHRSDALSSLGALAGIIGARAGFFLMDSIASLVICLFIVKASVDIFRDSIGKMVDRSCSEQTEKEIALCALEHEGVRGIDSIKTRIFGNRIYVDITIFTDSDISLIKSDRIAEKVHDAIEFRFEKIKHITVCVKPLREVTENTETDT